MLHIIERGEVMTHRIQLLYQNQPLDSLYVIMKTWDGDYVTCEQHLYTDEEGFLMLPHCNNIQICMDDRCIFKDFDRFKISEVMDLEIDQERYSLLMHKLKYIISHYQIPQSENLNKLYRQYQKIMGIEAYSIHHYFILSIINQMYLELQ